jgi:uncharacterized protein (TIRG00374 family)
MSTQITDNRSASSGRAKQIARILVIVAVLALSLWYALRGVEWGKLWQTILSVNILWVIVAVATTMGAHVARGQRWRVLIPEGRSISLRNAVSATIIGYMMSNVIPRSGELARPYVLARREGRSMSSLLATVVVERILDALTLVLIFVLLLFMEAGRLEQILAQADIHTSTSGIVLALAIPLLAMVVAIVLAVKTPIGDRLLDWMGRKLSAPLAAKLRTLLDEFRAGIAFGGTGSLVRISFWTVVIWMGYALSFYCGFRAFGFDTLYGLGLWEMVPMLAITTIAITIAPTPGAFGFYHATCKAALVSLYGVPADQAVAFALVMHAAPYLAVMILGVFFSLRESISFGEAMRGSAQPEPLSSGEVAVDPILPH